MSGSLDYEYVDSSSNHALILNDNTDGITQSIISANTYEFSVKLIASNMETLTAAGIYETTEQESGQALVNCYTNPAAVSGKYWIPNSNHLFSCLIWGSGTKGYFSFHINPKVVPLDRSNYG